MTSGLLITKFIRCVVQVPFNLHKTERVLKAKEKELNTLKKFGTFKDLDIQQLSSEQKGKVLPTTWNIVQKDVNNRDTQTERTGFGIQFERG